MLVFHPVRQSGRINAGMNPDNSVILFRNLIRLLLIRRNVRLLMITSAILFMIPRLI